MGMRARKKDLVRIDSKKMRADMKAEHFNGTSLANAVGYSHDYPGQALRTGKCAKAYAIAVAALLHRTPEYYILPDEPAQKVENGAATDAAQSMISGDIAKAIKGAAAEAYTAVNLNTSGTADAVRDAIKEQTLDNTAYHQSVLHILASIDKHLVEMIEAWEK